MCETFRKEFHSDDIPWSNSYCKVSVIADRRFFFLKKVGWLDSEINKACENKQQLRLCLLHFHPHDIFQDENGAYTLAKTCLEISDSKHRREFRQNMPRDKRGNYIPIPTCTKQNLKEYIVPDRATRIIAESSVNSSAQKSKTKKKSDSEKKKEKEQEQKRQQQLLSKKE